MSRRTYAHRICILCGRLIREGAWGAKDSNFKRHMAAHERQEAKKTKNNTQNDHE